MKKYRTNAIIRLYHQLGSPPSFYRISGYFLKWLLLFAMILTAIGLYDGLVLAPADYQQGDSFRIIYVHVPAAWMSMFIYVLMGIAALIALIWRMKVAEAVMIASAPIGAWFTLITLVTGSLWGKPMWGTWWEWDARMTSELILLFLYIGVMATYTAFSEDARKAARMAALVAVVGLVNIPIIHFSVEWWSSIHQGTTVSFIGESHITWDMLRPLLIMAVATKLYYGYSMLKRARIYLLETEQQKRWAQDVVMLAEKQS
ncbi:MAG: heme ABC transporter permease [Proteobacteria bacterium]|nr:heme ABC transporter permease [Pseudomonadota bacterium]